MREPDEARRWLDQAREDLKWTRSLYDQGAFYLVCFLSQQVAEKALKAFLYGQGEEVVLGHSVARLCEAAVRYDASIAKRCDRWGILDTYYVTARYPNSLPGTIPAQVFQRETAHGALQLADEAFTFVEARLAGGLPPRE